MPFNFVKSFYFSLFFFFIWGVGVLYEGGWWLYIFMFLYHKIIWSISTYVQNMYILIKQHRPIKLSWAVKQKKKNFCNTKTLNLYEHRSVSVCAPLPLAILILSLASSAAFNKSLVCSFFHLASFGFCLFLAFLLYRLTSCNIFNISHPVYCWWVVFCPLLRFQLHTHPI